MVLEMFYGFLNSHYMPPVQVLGFVIILWSAISPLSAIMLLRAMKPSNYDEAEEN
jgi:hypothetical protein